MSQTIDNCIIAARAELQAARQSLVQEISSYPTPISGCDAQFNHLLSQRQTVEAALGVLGRDVFIPTPRMPTQHSAVESR